MFRVAIIGGQNTNDYAKFAKTCVHLLKNKANSGVTIMINTIGDEYVDRFSKHFCLCKRYFQAEWKTFGNNALVKRDEAIVKESDALIFFRTKENENTSIVTKAKEKGLNVRVINMI